MIFLVLVNEFSHYIRRKDDLYKDIFGVDFIYGLTLEEAEKIYNSDNWNTIDFFKNNFHISNSREVVKYMKTYSDWGDCIERFN